MKLHQLSLFMENKPGQLVAPARVLANAGINIVTLSLADTQQFGILRLIVKDWQKAKAAMEASGSVVNVTEVVAIEVADRPGGLADVLAIFDANGINVEYMYAFTFGRGDRAVLIFRFEDPDMAIKILQTKGVNVIGSVELFERIER